MKRTGKHSIIGLLVIMMLVLTSCSLSACRSDIGSAKDTETETAQISLADIPDYTGSPATVINDGVPFFTEKDLSEATESDWYEEYGSLDKLGRCTSCTAYITRAMMPGEDEVRGDISGVEPTGWQYDSGYERCHLIAWCLSGQNDNILNLITGTHYFNVDGMLPYEIQVANYVRDTGMPVLYRVTPMYAGDNMVASGVLMEALSLEDDGRGLCFNVFCYNVFPDPATTLDYATGIVTRDEPAADAENSDAEEYTFILNTSRMKIHYPDCKSVYDMAEHNKLGTNESVAELEAKGYTPCGNCHPHD